MCLRHCLAVSRLQESLSVEGVQPEFSFLCNQLLASLIDRVEAQVREMNASTERQVYRE